MTDGKNEANAWESTKEHLVIKAYSYFGSNKGDSDSEQVDSV